MGRPYTGWDGDAKGRRPGTEKLIQLIAQHTGKALWNNGSWGVRAKRGKSSPSVHGTARAFDMSWRKMENRGSGRYDDAHRVMEFLTRPDVADALGIEAVFDYWNHYGPHGRGWKCDRGAWQVYDRKAFSGVPGDWIHVEVSPALADDPAAVNHYFLHFWNLYEGGAPVAPAPVPAPAPAPQPATADTSKKADGKSTWTGRAMRKGSRGERVKVVQGALNQHGHNCGPVDGSYGAKTEAAVKAFQAANQPDSGPVDGVVGKVTWAILVD
jgi:hypothetical protein